MMLLTSGYLSLVHRQTIINKLYNNSTTLLSCHHHENREKQQTIIYRLMTLRLIRIISNQTTANSLTILLLYIISKETKQAFFTAISYDCETNNLKLISSDTQV